MAGEPTTTLIGNLVDDPELRYTASGTAVTNVTIAINPRTKDAKGEWVDGNPIFVRTILWRDLAEHAAETLRRGQRVIAHGRLTQRTYEKNDTKHTVTELECEDLGLSCRFAPVTDASRAKDTDRGGRRR